MSNTIDRGALERLHSIGGADFVSEMLDLALRNIEAQLVAGQAAASRDDAKGIAVAIHSIAGSAGNIGAVELEQLAREGLSQSDALQQDELERVLSKLRDALTRARPLLEEAIRERG